MRITVIGNIYTDAQRILKVSELISEQGHEVFNGLDEMRQLAVEQGHDWIDNSFELMLSQIDKADAVVIIPIGECYNKSWVLGYCYANGIPVLVFTEKDEDFPESLSNIKSFHAHIRGWQELKDYDFIEMPVNFYTGELVVSHIKPYLVQTVGA